MADQPAEAPPPPPPEKLQQRRATVDLTGHPPTGYVISLIHLLKGVVGVGIFALGNAFKNGGLYLSPPLLILMACVVVHCQHLLVESADRVKPYHKDLTPIDYGTTMRLCFIATGKPKFIANADKMAFFTNICICISQVGFCCVYLVFISTNISEVLKAHGIDINLRILILIVWIPVWLATLITNLKALAPVSLLANCLLFGSFFATITIAYMDKGFMDIDKLKPYTDLWHFFIFLGTAIFAFETISMILPIRCVMRKPLDFNKPLGVLNVGCAIVLILYMISGLTGYLVYGEDVKGSLTLNLGQTVAAQCVQIAVAIGIVFSYPLHIWPPISVLLPIFIRNCFKDKPFLGEMIFRTMVTVFTATLAVIVLDIGLFVSLIGAFCSNVLALIFPPISELLLLSISQQSETVKNLVIFKNIILLLLGVMAFAIGTAISLTEIVQHYE